MQAPGEAREDIEAEHPDSLVRLRMWQQVTNMVIMKQRQVAKNQFHGWIYEVRNRCKPPRVRGNRTKRQAFCVHPWYNQKSSSNGAATYSHCEDCGARTFMGPPRAKAKAKGMLENTPCHCERFDQGKEVAKNKGQRSTGSRTSDSGASAQLITQAVTLIRKLVEALNIVEALNKFVEALAGKPGGKDTSTGAMD